MKVPRFRIAWAMVGIAVAALDFAAIRAFLAIPEVFYVGMGALPIANALVVGTLVAQRRPASRPFLLGFVVFGAMALVIFVAATLASLFLDDYRLITSYLAPVIEPIEKSIGQDRPLVLIPLEWSAIMVMLAWPQVVFALIGGFLSRRFKITITRR